MNGTNGNEPGYPENALGPYPVIVVATKGDPDAMKIVLQHFSGYIACPFRCAQYSRSVMRFLLPCKRSI